MDRRRSLLLNTGEVLTDAALRNAADTHGARVFPKARLASALNIDRSGLNDREYRYALKAELDFVVAEGESGKPCFAVEFDEPHHSTDPVTIDRDRIKNSICDRLGLPLLRIGADFLKERRQQALVGWILEVFFLEREFTAMQERGQIAYDEPFMYSSIFEPGKPGAGPFGITMALDSEARGLMSWVFSKESGSPRHVPEQMSTRNFGGEPCKELESFCVFELNEGRFIIGYAKLRNFGYFGGVSAWELVNDLAVADCGDKLRLYRKAEGVASSAEQLTAIRRRTVGWTRQGMMLDDLAYDPRAS